MSPAKDPGWWQRLDPLVLVVGVTALVLYTLHGFDGLLKRDSAIYTYAGQQVFDGVPPYVGVLNRVGPLAHILPGLGVAGARVAGIDDLLGVRALFMILAVGAVCLAYIVGRDMFASKLAGLASATALFSFYGFIKYATYGPKEKTAMVLFLLLSLHALVKRRWLFAGIGMSLATLVWQPVLLVAVIAAISSSFGLERSDRLHALGRFAVGGLTTLAIFVIYFITVGAWTEFLDSFLVINARYTVPAPLLSRVGENWTAMKIGYGLTLWVLIAGWVGVGILSVRALVRQGVRGWFRDPIVWVGAATLVGLAWTVRDFNHWPDAFVLLPMGALGIGGIAKWLTERLPPSAAVPLVLSAVVAGTVIGGVYSATRLNRRLPKQRAAVAAMLEQLPPETSILSIGAPEPLVLSGKVNPTRYQTFTRGLDRYMDETWPGGLRGFGEWVAREQPTVISLDKEQVPWWLRETLDEGYVLAGTAPGWTWYVHRSAVPEEGLRHRRPSRR